MSSGMSRVIVTGEINSAIKADPAFSRAVSEFLARFAMCDWGDLSPDDCSANDSAERIGEQVLAAYDLPPGLHHHQRPGVVTLDPIPVALDSTWWPWWAWSRSRWPRPISPACRPWTRSRWPPSMPVAWSASRADPRRCRQWRTASYTVGGVRERGNETKGFQVYGLLKKTGGAVACLVLAAVNASVYPLSLSWFQSLGLSRNHSIAPSIGVVLVWILLFLSVVVLLHRAFDRWIAKRSGSSNQPVSSTGL